jgi:outer membrane cobalamin receptor
MAWWPLLLVPAPAPPAIVHSESIVVVAERSPEPLRSVAAAVTVLEPREVERSPVLSLSEALDRVPGLLMLQAERHVAGPPMLVARGFFGAGEAEYVQLRVDGVAVGDPESGVVDWRRLGVGDVERVEVLRGAASSVYGDTALGGVVDVVTRSSGAAGSRRATASAGSFASAGLDAALEGRRGRVFAGGFRSDGHRHNGASREAAAGASIHGGRWHLALSGEGWERRNPGPLDDAQLAADPEASDDLFSHDRERGRRGRAAWTIEGGQGGGAWQATLFGAARRGEGVRTLLLLAGFGDSKARELRTASAGSAVEKQVESRRASLRYGVDLGRDWLDTEYHDVDDLGGEAALRSRAENRRDRAALFASAGWRPHPRLRVALGLRWDRVRDDFALADRSGQEAHDAWSPRLGLTADLGIVQAYAQVARAFKAPTPDQLFDPRPFPDFAGGSFVISNPELRPQHARSFEGGLRRAGASAHGEIVYYRMRVDDEIDFDPATFRYTNIGESLHEGVEAAASFWTTRRVAPFAAYTWSRVEPTAGENRGHQLKNVPRHVLRGGFHAGLGRGVRLTVRGSLLAGRFLDDAERFPMSDAAVWDLRLDRPSGRARPFLDLLNLTDAQTTAVGYVLPDLSGVPTALHFPAPGLAVRAGLDWSF